MYMAIELEIIVNRGIYVQLQLTRESQHPLDNHMYTRVMATRARGPLSVDVFEFTMITIIYSIIPNIAYTSFV